ncbi:MAG: hypothetical protein ACTHOR_17865 [Devosia sp.]
MILAIGLAAFLAASCLAICALWRPTLLTALIPCLFALAFYGATLSPQWAGYAVEGKFLTGQEATVLDAIEGGGWIYLLVQMTGAREPRLVRLPATDQNRKDAEAAKKQAQQGLAVIRFGPGQQGQPGDGSNPDDGIRLLDLAQSRDFGKTPAPQANS